MPTHLHSNRKVGAQAIKWGPTLCTDAVQAHFGVSALCRAAALRPLPFRVGPSPCCQSLHMRHAPDTAACRPDARALSCFLRAYAFTMVRDLQPWGTYPAFTFWPPDPEALTLVQEDVCHGDQIFGEGQ